MRRTRRWDLVVIGAGAAGIVAAKTAATFGASVLLVDEREPGGDCLWTGCVPSKALLAAAAAAANARSATALGVHCGDVRVDFTEVMAHVHRSIDRVAPKDSRPSLEAEGVTVRLGLACFTGTSTMDVSGQTIRFRRAVLATGASPVLPGIAGLGDVAALTSDTVWQLTALPARLVVLGGGSIGCELGQAFARLGSQVTLIDAAARLMPLEDRAAAEILTTALRADGVQVLTGKDVTRVERAEGARGTVVTASGARLDFDELLLAVGRRPNTHSVGVRDAGIELDPGGFVRVDAHLRTTNPRVWAAGDLTGHPQFTHTAGVHGSIAASNALLGVRRRADTALTPRVTFTSPEVAAVGVSPDSARSDPRLRVLSWPHTDLDRAVTEDDTRGHTELVVDDKGRVLGATIVGPRAGESLAEVVLAARLGLRTRVVASTTHAYPTYSDGVWNTSIADVQQRFATPVARLVTAVLLRVRRLGALR